MDPSSFCALLEATLNPDSAVRREAESRITELKKGAPDVFVSCLLQTLGEHPAEQLRLQAAVLLRSSAFGGSLDGETNVWGRLSQQTRENVKTSLIRCVENESSKTVRSNICNTAADLACDLVPIDQWPTLGPQLLSLIYTNEPHKQQGALHILSEVIPALGPQLGSTDGGPQLAALVRGCLSTAKPAETRAEALSLLVALVEDAQRSIYRKVGTAESPVALLVIAAIEAALRQAGAEVTQGEAPDCQLAERVLGLVVQLLEADRGGGAALFKGHVSLVLDYLLSLANAGKALPSLAEPGAACAATADKAEGFETVRRLAIEAVLCYAEQKPQTIAGCTESLKETIATLLRCMLEAQGEDYEDWFQSGEESDDDQRMYDIGEEGLDRVARCFDEHDDEAVGSSGSRRKRESLSAATNMLPLLAELIKPFLVQEHWVYRFVALMAISQTVEYIPSGEEQQLAAVVDTVAKGLRDSDFHVRFAACQCLGQLSLDHAPTVQHEYSHVLLEPLIGCFSDPTPRVRSHACAAFVNFAEELEKKQMREIVQVVMPKILQLADTSSPLLVRQHAITCVAVIAGVLEKEFQPYYSAVLPALLRLVQETNPQGTHTETVLLSNLKCKAIEAASIVGYSVGREVFAPDSGFVMEQLLQLYNATEAPLTADSKSNSTSSTTDGDETETVREYLTEAIARLCRVMEADFIPFLGRLLPQLFSVLSVEPKIVKEDEIEAEEGEDAFDGAPPTGAPVLTEAKVPGALQTSLWVEGKPMQEAGQQDWGQKGNSKATDMTYVMIDEGKSLGLRTSLLEEQERALELLQTIFSVLAKPLAAAAAVAETADEVRGLLVQTGRAVTPLLRHLLSESVKERALEATGALLGVLALCPLLNDIRKALLVQTLNDTFSSLSEAEAEPDSIQSQASGLVQCIETAGGGILDAVEVAEQVRRVLELLGKSSERRTELAAKRHAEEELEDDDLTEIEDDEETEQTLRSTLVELIGALMASHPAEFLGGPSIETALQFAEGLLVSQACSEDKAVGLFVCCDILQHLKGGAMGLWPRFLPQVLECLLCEDQRVVQAAAYGVQQAAKIEGFANFAGTAANSLLQVIRNGKDKRGKLHAAAIDNAVAALGDLVEYQGTALGSEVHALTATWLEQLPLKQDATEGIRVHRQLLDALQRDRNGFFSGDIARVSRALGVLAGIYKTTFVDADLEKDIVTTGGKVDVEVEPTLKVVAGRDWVSLCEFTKAWNYPMLP
ncbi:heat repeat-containing protein [Cyclospora cayetanensis]|uniref:Heat repeat-containing protein n=1 Tax=Cyclospora cayetanensis TaxID=88456 RepID=A0A1D3DB10_9EIME|nr:heat repeat-containing protein [Cyclospora cayetanensis]